MQRIRIRDWQKLLGPWNRKYRSKKERKPEFMFAHLHEEVSEAWKCWREGGKELTGWLNTVTKHGKELTKPEGLGPELADVVGMAIIIAEELDIDLEYELERKWEYLKARLAAKNAKKGKK